MMKRKAIEKATVALLRMKSGEHDRQRKPTKADLQRKFVTGTDRKGKAKVREVVCQLSYIIPLI